MEKPVEVLEQTESSAEVRMTETETRLLSLAMRYWRGRMNPESPLVDDLSERLQKITAEFDAEMEAAEGR